MSTQSAFGDAANVYQVTQEQAMNVSKVKYLFRRKLIKFLLISDTGRSEEKLRVLPTSVEPVAPCNDEREIARQSWIVDSTP